jgi:ABC-type sugar transport system permease subunit
MLKYQTVKILTYANVLKCAPKCARARFNTFVFMLMDVVSQIGLVIGAAAVIA